MRDPREDALWSLVGTLLGVLAIVVALVLWMWIVGRAS
jgi:hypothetical protein